MFSQLTLAQKILYLSLIGLVILMVIFSFGVRNFFGEEGFERCIQDKCELNKEQCRKAKTINNCCIGAGGQIAYSESELTCIF